MSLHKLTAGDGYTYLTRQVAALDSTEKGHTGLADYYGQQGETPGKWLGNGLLGIDGLNAGDSVTEEQMKALFGEGRHPNASGIETDVLAAGGSAADALMASALGRAFPIFEVPSRCFRVRCAEAFAGYNAALDLPRRRPVPAAERARIRTEVARVMFNEAFGRPAADARELSGFIARASRPVTTAVAGYDLTFSPVKSVSALWAVAPRAVAERVEAAHHAAVAETLGWLEKAACFTRVGAGGIRQVDTTGLIAATFTHRDSRAGDPDLHTHVAVSNKVRTLDGRWLALDGRVLHKATVAASERYNTRLEAQLVARLGVTFADRPGRDPSKRPVREIVGVDERLLTAWSQRRQAIDARRGQLATAFQADHGRPPTPVEAIALAQQATLETRGAKHEPRSLGEQRFTWRREAMRLIGGPNAIDRMLSDVQTSIPSGHARLTQAWVEAAADRALATVSGQRATWQLWHVQAEAERQVRSGGITPDDVDRAVTGIVDAALSPARSVPLGSPELFTEPASLRRADGASVYTVAGSQLYTAQPILDAEQFLVTSAGRTNGRRVGAVAVELAVLESAANGVALNPAQAQLVRELATSGSRVQLAIAPAGSGKTTALRVLARAWSDNGGHVVGLAPTAAAAAALGEQIGGSCDTLSKLTWSLRSETPRPGWVNGIDAHTLVLIDEAGMAGTIDLARAVRFVLDRGGSVRLVGDDQQLAAVAAGGVLRDIATVHGAVSLSALVRFTDPTEAAATLAIRGGDPAGLGFYLDHGRIHIGGSSAATDLAYSAWAADRSAGLDCVMLAPTRELVAELNARARADRLLAAGGPPGPEVALRDGNKASVGDTVISRRNDRSQPITATDWVKNGDRWTVTAVHRSGFLDVAQVGTNRRTTLPATYVRDSVELGYAATVHAAQGITADSCHTVLSGAEHRQLLYVALTRGRGGNHLYVTAGGDGDPHSLITPTAVRPPTATDILTGILARDQAQRSATSAARDLADPAAVLQQAVARYQDGLAVAAETTLGHDMLTWLGSVAEWLRPGLSHAPGWPTLRGRLALLTLDGRDPVTALTGAAVARELHTATDPAAVLSWRLDPAGAAGRPDGPLPWLPAIPAGLTEHPEWDAYLNDMARLIADHAQTVRDRAAAMTPAAAPTWATRLTKPEHVQLRADLTVWRAATGTPEYDGRPAGAPRAVTAERRHQDHLNRQVSAIVGQADRAAASWVPVLDRLDARVTRDEHWPALAEQLDAAHRDDLDVPALLTTVTDSRPLPDDLPAAALQWRISAYLTHAEGDPASARLPSRCATPDPFAEPAAAAQDPADYLIEEHRWTTAAAPRARLLELNQLAADYFAARYPGSWSQDYVVERLGADVTGDPRFTPGHAPTGWTALTDHLRDGGATDTELVAAGLAVQARTDGIVDRFRDRLTFPVRDVNGDIRGFIARRNPDCDDTGRAGPKYLNTADTDLFRKGDQLFGLHENRDALAAGAVPVLVEGPIDALAVTLAGNRRYVGVATMGTACTDRQADQLRPYSGADRVGVIIGTDADAAGEMAAERAYWQLTARGGDPRHLDLPRGLDPADMLRLGGPAALFHTLDRAGSLAEHLLARRAAEAKNTDTVEGHTAAIRAAGEIIGALPPRRWTDHIDRVAVELQAVPGSLQLAVLDAGHAWTLDPVGQARARLRDSQFVGMPERSRIGGIPAAAPASASREALPNPWAQLANRIDPRLSSDADWPQLTAAFNRAHYAGHDLVATLPRLTGQEPLPGMRPAAELLKRLYDDCDGARPQRVQAVRPEAAYVPQHIRYPHEPPPFLGPRHGHDAPAPSR